MRKAALTVVALLFAVPALAGIYRSINFDGSVVYSDQPRPGAERIEPGTVQTIETRKVELPELDAQPEPEDEPAYTRFAISQPREDQTLRDNAGKVAISLEVEPGLAIGKGHRVQVFLDGEPPVAPAATTRFTLGNIDRGTHTVSAEIIDASEKSIASTGPVTFHLQQATRLLP